VLAVLKPEGLSTYHRHHQKRPFTRNVSGFEHCHIVLVSNSLNSLLAFIAGFANRNGLCKVRSFEQIIGDYRRFAQATLKESIDFLFPFFLPEKS
jgi:hypothetical protein